MAAVLTPSPKLAHLVSDNALVNIFGYPHNVPMLNVGLLDYIDSRERRRRCSFLALGTRREYYSGKVVPGTQTRRHQAGTSNGRVSSQSQHKNQDALGIIHLIFSAISVDWRTIPPTASADIFLYGGRSL